MLRWPSGERPPARIIAAYSSGVIPVMAVRHASINDVAIAESERLFLWEQGPRPADHPGLSALGL